MSLLLLSGFFIYLLHIKHKTDYITNYNLFLILLGITPFAQNCLQLRPEIIGNMLIVLGLIFYRLWDISQGRKLFYYYSSAIYLGLSIALHPNFTIASGILIFVILLINLRKVRISHTLFFVLIVSIPSVIVLGWYLKDYPESIMQFRQQVSRHESFRAGAFIRLFNESFLLGHWDSLKIKLFYALLWFPLFVVLITTLVLILKRLKAIIRHDSFNVIFITALIIIIALMVIDRGSDSYFAIYAFFILLFFTYIVTFNKGLVSEMQQNKKFSTKLITIVFIMLVLAHSIIHTVKFQFSSEKYYFAPRAFSHVSESLKPDDTLFLCESPRQVAMFYNLLDAKYRGDIRTNDVFVVRAIKGQIADRKRLREILLKKIRTISFEKTIWGLRKRNINKLAPSNTMFEWEPSTLQVNGMKPFSLVFNVKEVVYDDKEQMFIRPNNIIF
tara:strand:+ start:673 stop:2001 length:1329 start_codon:yes stop_codon:yes gene_type:complete